MTAKFSEKRWVGVFVHIMEDGEILNQGCIVSCDGDFVIRRFSFNDGRPTDTIRLSPQELMNRCRFYDTADEMRRAYCIATGGDLGWHEKVEEAFGLCGSEDPTPSPEQMN